jgi:hypothetical protein
MLKGAEDDQYSSMGEGGHTPLQAFFGAGRGGANGCAHFAELLAGVFGSGINIFADGLGSRFLLLHDYLSIDSAISILGFSRIQTQD